MISLTKPKEEREKLKGPVVPPDVDEKMKRGRKVMMKRAPLRRLCVRFWRNDQYWFLNEKNALSFQDTVTHARGKPRHRIRNTYNFIHSVVEGKVSSATQRVPSYEVIPTTSDPEDAGGAKIAEKVALYGYDKWKVRRATVKVVQGALVQGEGFAMPYWDPNVGPFLDLVDTETQELKKVGQGEVKIMTLSSNEVYWENGCEFEESPWWCIERAVPIGEAEQTPGFYGGKLAPDATTTDVPTDREVDDNLVTLTKFIERPSPKHPKGRVLNMANGHVICPPEEYPCQNGKGEVVDEPVIHRLSYVVDFMGDRDRGLVELILDLQRTINDCWSKLLEWKNRCLNPQMISPVGGLISRPTDEPGAIKYYRPVGGQTPQWENPPPVPRELFQMLDLALDHLRAISADVDVEAEPDVAARTVSAVIETYKAKWQTFLGDLAEFHSHLMRHCLYLVAKHYTEERLIAIKGAFGPDRIPDFTGAALKDQTDIRVLPGSLEQRSRKALTEETMLFADRGWISPQAAMARISGGTADVLANAYEYDVRRAYLIIEKIRQGPEKLFSTPDTPDGTPGWMPRDFDDPDIWLQVLGTWMKTEEYDRLEPGMQEAANLVYKGLQQLQLQKQIQAAQMQAEMAGELGMANASKPQQVSPTPDQRMPELPEGEG